MRSQFWCGVFLGALCSAIFWGGLLQLHYQEQLEDCLESLRVTIEICRERGHDIRWWGEKSEL